MKFPEDIDLILYSNEWFIKALSKHLMQPCIIRDVKRSINWFFIVKANTPENNEYLGLCLGLWENSPEKSIENTKGEQNWFKKNFDFDFAECCRLFFIQKKTYYDQKKGRKGTKKHLLDSVLKQYDIFIQETDQIFTCKLHIV